MEGPRHQPSQSNHAALVTREGREQLVISEIPVGSRQTAEVYGDMYNWIPGVISSKTIKKCPP